MDKFISHLVKYIGETNPEYSELQLKKMEYGLVCFFNEITKIIPYFIIFYIFGLHFYFLTALLFFSSMRLFTGGYHAKTYWGCFFISFMIFCLIIYAGSTVTLYSVVKTSLLLISLIFVILFSPVDNINKRIKSKKRRLRLKFVSVIMFIILLGLIYIFPFKYSTTAAISIFTAVVMMMLGFIDNKTAPESI